MCTEHSPSQGGTFAEITKPMILFEFTITNILLAYRVVWLINIHHISIAYLLYPSVESLKVSKKKRKQTIQLTILHLNTQNIIQ